MCVLCLPFANCVCVSLCVINDFYVSGRHSTIYDAFCGPKICLFRFTYKQQIYLLFYDTHTPSHFCKYNSMFDVAYMTSLYSSRESGKSGHCQFDALTVAECADFPQLIYWATLNIYLKSQHATQTRSVEIDDIKLQTSHFGIEISFPLTEQSLANYSLAFCKSRNRTQPTGCQVLNYRFGIRPNAKLHKFISETKSIRSFSASIKYIGRIDRTLYWTAPTKADNFAFAFEI